MTLVYHSINLKAGTRTNISSSSSSSSQEYYHSVATINFENTEHSHS